MRSILQTPLRRHIFPSARQTVFSAGGTRTAVAAFTTETNERCYQSLTPAWFLLSASLAAAATVTRCEEEEQLQDDLQEEEEQLHDDLQEEEDPYDNLPEEDEPTHCSICMTYRQGPCRPYWKKVEACTKDNELKEDDKKQVEDEEKSETEEESEEEQRDPPCLKYMLPWIDCATGFRNLYNLIELDTNYTMGIADLEKDASQNLCWAPANSPPIDWSGWQTYLENNENWTLPDTQELEEKVSLWKSLDQSKDPELVEIQATVAMTQHNGILECAYAQDQDGNVIGFQYGTKPSDAAKAKEEIEEKEESSVTLKIRILPQKTQTVTIAAAYTHVDKEKEEVDGKGGSSFHSFIFKSRPYSIDAAVKRSED